MKWPLVRVGEIATQHRGVSYSKDESRDQPFSGFMPIFRANNITNSGLTLEDLVYVPIARVSSVQQVRAGDVIVAASSGSLDVVGKAAQATRDDEISFGAFCKLVRPGGRVHPRYFGHYFKTTGYRRIISSLAAGANINNLRHEHIDNLELAFPPLEEQRRIAAILDQAEALRAKRRQALAKLDTLTQSLFLEMFGDPRINSKGWRLKKLGEVCRLDRGISKHRPRNAPELLNGSYPLIQTGDVANCNGRVNTYSSTYSEAGLKQSRLWPAGTLCITIAANIAKTAVLGIDACFPDSVVGLVPGESMTIEFVQAWLSFLQQGLEESAPESAQKNINLEILRSLQIIEPPKSKQIDFSDAVSSHYAIRRRYEQSFIAEVRLSLSLQHRAFRGEL